MGLANWNWRVVHGAESSRHESATFAYKLMLDGVGEQGGHSSELSRQDLQEKYEDKYQESQRKADSGDGSAHS